MDHLSFVGGLWKSDPSPRGPGPGPAPSLSIVFLVFFLQTWHHQLRFFLCLLLLLISFPAYLTFLCLLLQLSLFSLLPYPVMCLISHDTISGFSLIPASLCSRSVIPTTLIFLSFSSSCSPVQSFPPQPSHSTSNSL